MRLGVGNLEISHVVMHDPTSSDYKTAKQAVSLYELSLPPISVAESASSG